MNKGRQGSPHTRAILGGQGLIRGSLFCAALVISQCAQAAEQPHPNSLENYLKKLQYAPIEFRYDKNQNQPTVEGQLNGKKCTFIVDSGWAASSLDPSAAA